MEEVKSYTNPKWLRTQNMNLVLVHGNDEESDTQDVFDEFN